MHIYDFVKTCIIQSWKNGTKYIGFSLEYVVISHKDMLYILIFSLNLKYDYQRLHICQPFVHPSHLIPYSTFQMPHEQNVKPSILLQSANFLVVLFVLSSIRAETHVLDFPNIFLAICVIKVFLTIVITLWFQLSASYQLPSLNNYCEKVLFDMLFKLSIRISN